MFSAGEYLRPHPRFQAGKSGSTNEAGRTHGAPRCQPPASSRCGNRRIPPSSCARRFKLPQLDRIALSLDAAITRSAQRDRHAHRCICIATTQPGHLRDYGSKHPPGLRAYVAVNGHVRAWLTTRTLALPFYDTAASTPRVTHMNEHGTEAGTARATVRPTIEVRPQGLDTSGPGVSRHMARNDGREGTCSTTPAYLAHNLPTACAHARRTQQAVVSVGAPRSVGSAPALKRTPTSQLRRRFR